MSPTILIIRVLWWIALLGFLPVFGSVYLLLLAPLTGGRWLESTAPTFRRLARAWWLAAIVFGLLLLGYAQIAFWPSPVGDKAEQLAEARAGWFNWRSFLLRQAVVFVFLGWAAEVARRIPREAMARAGLMMIGLTLALFAFSVDWVLARNVEFFSTVFPFVFILLGVASALLLATWRAAPAASPTIRRHFAGLTQAALTLVVYVALMEFLIVWMGDLPRETEFYVSRGQTPLRWAVIYAVVFGWALPFFSLLPFDRRIAAGPLRLATAFGLSGIAAFLLWLCHPFHV